MNGAMYALETFINHEWLWRGLDTLIQAALVHFQFETIHPFLNGNARIGRLLITLLLMERKTLTVPVLYISYFLKKNRYEYYDRIIEVRTKGYYEQWVKFFLLAVYESATDAIESFDKLTDLHNRNTELLNMQKASAVIINT
jgi:Fic family protein